MIRLRSSDPLGADLEPLVRLLGGSSPSSPPVVVQPPPVDPPPVTTPPVTPPPIANFPPIDGAAMIPYVQWQGDPGNGPAFVTQARVNIAPADVPTLPFFLMGFFLARDSMFGMLTAIGNQENPDAGLISLTLQGTMVRLFEWWFPAQGGWQVLADSNGTVKPNQWQHVCATITDTATRDLVVDGARAVPNVITAPFPTGALALTFGSYKTVTPGGSNVERHNFDGGLRDWALVRGVPTDAEITRHAAGESAVSIWGAARVWDAWSFTHDPALGPEPGINGHALTWIDGGNATGHHLPTLITS